MRKSSQWRCQHVSQLAVRLCDLEQDLTCEHFTLTDHAPTDIPSHIVSAVMGKSGKKKTKYSKRDLNNALMVYLENANPAQLSLAGWTRNWSECHGETRSKSSRTFHIQARQNSAGHYLTRILDSELGAIEGTEIDWGDRPPSLSRVLEYYQAMFGLRDYPSSSSSSEAGGDNGDGGSGGGSSSGYLGPYADEYGGFFYLDNQGNYYPCDQSGHLLDTSGVGYTEATYYRMCTGRGF